MGNRTGNPRGRPKGSANKASVERQTKIEASGLTPLEYMLSILRDDSADPEQRFEAAKAAAPYTHPRLSSVEAKLDIEAKVKVRRIERVVIDPSNPDAAGVPATAQAGEV